MVSSLGGTPALVNSLHPGDHTQDEASHKLLSMSTFWDAPPVGGGARIEGGPSFHRLNSSGYIQGVDRNVRLFSREPLDHVLDSACAIRRARQAGRMAFG